MWHYKQLPDFLRIRSEVTFGYVIGQQCILTGKTKTKEVSPSVTSTRTWSQETPLSPVLKFTFAQ